MTAAILAGGQSRRMGYDKHRIAISGQNLLDSLIEQLRPHFGRIIVVANTDIIVLPAEVLLVHDAPPYAGKGPLAGLHAALAQAGSDYVFLTACDMPQIDPAAIRALQNLIGDDEPDACCWRQKGRLQPFQAFYHRRLLPRLETWLSQGRLKAQGMLAEIDCRAADIEELALPSDTLININTPQDLADWVSRSDRKEQ